MGLFGDYDGPSEYETLVEEYPDAANLASAEDARNHHPILEGVYQGAPSDDGDGPSEDHRDEFGLPGPEPYAGDGFTALDYDSEEYADAETLGDAIKKRGRKAFFDKVMPEDFAPTANGVDRLGIASLW